MTHPEVIAAWQRWRQLADKGYGRTTSQVLLERIDARIRRAKERFEEVQSRHLKGGTY